MMTFYVYHIRMINDCYLHWHHLTGEIQSRSESVSLCSYCVHPQRCYILVAILCYLWHICFDVNIFSLKEIRS